MELAPEWQLWTALPSQADFTVCASCTELKERTAVGRALPAVTNRLQRPRLSLSSVPRKRFQHQLQLCQRFGAVAQLVLHVFTKFGKSLLVSRWDEQRIVAESALASGREIKPAF